MRGQIPRTSGLPDRLPLAANLDFALRDFGEECAAAALADQFVDGGNEIDREDYMGSACCRFRHIHSVIS